MQILPVPARKDNLMYIVYASERETEDTAIIVDPYNVDSIQAALIRENIPHKKLLCLTTHYHQDHSKGNSEVQKKFPGTKIVAGSEKSICTHICRDKEVIKHGYFSITCFYTPCHTKDSFCYYITYNNINNNNISQRKCIFVGDTLFYLGCGRFFEGSAEMMQQAFKKILSCPDNTNIYYGHDYKQSNLQFRSKILPNISLDPLILEKTFLTVKEERTYNFYINTDILEELEEFKNLTSTEKLALIRKKRDSFILS